MSPGPSSSAVVTAGAGAGAGVLTPVQRGSFRCSASSQGPEMSLTSSVVVPAVVVADVVVSPVLVAPGSDTVRAGSVSRPVAAA